MIFIESCYGKNLIDDLNVLMNWVFKIWMKNVELCIIFIESFMGKSVFDEFNIFMI